MRHRRQGVSPLSGLLVVVLLGGGLFIWVSLPSLRAFFDGRAALMTPTASAVSVAQTTPASIEPTATPERAAQITPGPPSPAPTPSAPPTPSPAASGPREVARRYLQAWEQRQFAAMHGLLTTSAREKTPADKFVARYEAITEGATIGKLSWRLADQASGGATSATLPYEVDFQTGRLGTFTETGTMPLRIESGEWRIDWTPDLIFRDLTPDNRVTMYPYNPVRGAIVDRNGKPLAAQGKVLTLGLIPGRIQNETLVLQTLSSILPLKPDEIKRKYARAQPDWWIPLQDYPLSQRAVVQAKIRDLPGVLLEEKEARVYPNGPVGAHLIGYVTAVTAEDLKKLAPLGFEEGDVIGRAGVEASSDEILGGVRGGKLAVVTREGDVVRTIAERPAQPGGTVELAIDVDSQMKAEKALGEKTGSLVVLDPRDNSILALASQPRFDPNLFVLGISDADWSKLSADPRRPFQNRPVLSAYPTGSIFKVITMAAGIERGGYRPASPFVCTGRWDVLDKRRPFGDWKPGGHGQLDLVEGLVQSCNIVFYEVGHKLDTLDPSILPQFARQFGIGEPTGVNGLLESGGVLPSPEWKKSALDQPWFPGDAVNLAIGQGYLEATPLQMANLYSALATGGVLRTPLLIREVTTGEQGRQRKQSFTSQERRRLPVSAATLTAIRDGMVRVSSSPTGTAYYALRGFSVPTASKTGSAENQNPDAHAWFAGYAPVENPRVVVIAMVEGGRLGSEVAAPIGRKILEDLLVPR